MIERIILGLDISTKCTGVSIVYVDENEEIKPIVVTHLRHKVSSKITGIESLFLKCDLFMEKLKEILLENSLYKDGKSLITDVIIEEPLISSNNKYTVATLLRYNGMIAYRVYNLLKIIPKFISSADARMFGVPQLMAVRKYNKKGEIYPVKKIVKSIENSELVLFGAYPFDCAKKYILWNYISERFPEIQWIYDKKGDLKTENFDASDSLICVIGYLNYEKYHDTKPRVIGASNTENNELAYEFEFCNQLFSTQIDLTSNITTETNIDSFQDNK
jgi:hypothetical protein